MDDLTHVGPPKLGLQHLEPLDCIRVEANPPLTEAGKHPPPTGVGNRPLWAEAGSRPPQGVRLTCPQEEKELAMASHCSTDQSKRLKRMNPKVLHTQLVPHRPGGRLLAVSMNAWMVRTHLPATSPQRLSKPITLELRLER